MRVHKIFQNFRKTFDIDLFYNYSVNVSTIESMGFADFAHADNSFICHFTNNMTMILS